MSGYYWDPSGSPEPRTASGPAAIGEALAACLLAGVAFVLVASMVLMSMQGATVSARLQWQQRRQQMAEEARLGESPRGADRIPVDAAEGGR